MPVLTLLCYTRYMRIRKNICPECGNLKDKRAALCWSCRHKIYLNTKVCKKCFKELPLSAFRIRTRATPRPRSYCKACESIEEHDRWVKLPLEERQVRKKKAHQNEDKSKVALQVIRSTCKRFGFTPEVTQYVIGRIGTANKCDICGSDITGKRKRHIDHCHETLKFRGLLCNNCNHGLGHFKDNPSILQRAITYLLNSTLDQAPFGETQRL